MSRNELCIYHWHAASSTDLSSLIDPCCHKSSQSTARKNESSFQFFVVENSDILKLQGRVITEIPNNYKFGNNIQSYQCHQNLLYTTGIS